MSLDVWIERRSGIYVLTYMSGGCHPASSAEMNLWDSIPATVRQRAYKKGREIEAARKGEAMTAQHPESALPAWFSKPQTHPDFCDICCDDSEALIKWQSQLIELLKELVLESVAKPAPSPQAMELVRQLIAAVIEDDHYDGLHGAAEKLEEKKAAVLRALSPAPTLTWTVNRPTEPGFYLCVEPGKTDAEMERVYMDETVTEWYSPGLRRWEPIPTGTKWLGPIPLSIEPKPPEVTT